MSLWFRTDLAYSTTFFKVTLLSFELLFFQTKKEEVMPLRLGTTAPDFTAETTEGRLSFANGSAIAGHVVRTRRTSRPFARPNGPRSETQSDFDKRNVKVIGLSVDSVEDHKKWSKDIEETQEGR
jgi:hypothetical protein